TGGFYRNPLGYVVGSIVEKIEGLPSEATYNGYTVHWPSFGNLILGEMVITPYMRRISLIRFTYSNGSGGSGCSRGSTLLSAEHYTRRMRCRILLVFLAAVACSRPPSPQAAYAEAWNAFHQG